MRSHSVVSANAGKPMSRGVEHVSHPATESGESSTYNEKRETV